MCLLVSHKFSYLQKAAPQWDPLNGSACKKADYSYSLSFEVGEISLTETPSGSRWRFYSATFQFCLSPC